MRTLWSQKRAWLSIGTCVALLFMTAWTFAGVKATPVAPAKGKGQLIVHEWGTFLSVQGSNGETLGGMVDSDEVLPPFVESRGISTWMRSLMRQKMETPVTYFYTDRPLDVQVHIDMPKGILTHWYPAVRYYGPNPFAKGKATSAGSFLEWRRIHLIPASQSLPKDSSAPLVVETKNGQVLTGTIESEDSKQIRLVTGDDQVMLLAKDQIVNRQQLKSAAPALALQKVGPEQTWRFARETDSALVKVQSWNEKNEAQGYLEKFLFYRGLGTFQLPLEVRSTQSDNGGLSFTLYNRNPQALRSLFAVEVEKDTIRFAALGDLAGTATRTVTESSVSASPLPLAEGIPQVKRAVADALVSAGLYPKEAEAMVNTWEKSYFRTEGIRILYLLPRETVDGVIPIQIKPAPDKLERVMVGRVEVLTPQREVEIAKLVAGLGADEFKVRQAASARLARLGRIGEPALRRVMATTSDPEVRTRAQSLINKFGGSN